MTRDYTLKKLQTWMKEKDSPLEGMLIAFNHENTHRADEINHWLTKHARPYGSNCDFHQIAKTLFDSIKIILSGIGGDVSTEKKTLENTDNDEAPKASKKSIANRMGATSADFGHVNDRDTIEELLNFKPLSDAEQAELETQEKRHQAILELSDNKALIPLQLFKATNKLGVKIPEGTIDSSIPPDANAEKLRVFLKNEAAELQKQISNLSKAPQLTNKKKELLRALFLVALDSKTTRDVAMFIKPEMLEGLIDDYEKTSQKDVSDLRTVLKGYETDYKPLEKMLAIRNTKLDQLLSKEPEEGVEESKRRLNAFKKYIADIFPLSPKAVYEQINEMVDQFGVERIRSTETQRTFGELANEVYQKFLSDGTRATLSFYDQLGEDERARLTLAIGRACHYALHHNDPDYELTQSNDINRLELQGNKKLKKTVVIRAAGVNLQDVELENRLKGFKPHEGEEDLKEAINRVIERCKSQSKLNVPSDNSAPDR